MKRNDFYYENRNLTGMEVTASLEEKPSLKHESVIANAVKQSLLLSIAAFTLVACDKDDDEKEEPPVVKQERLFVLNSGKMDGNNSSLTLYDVESGEVTSTDAFKAQNNRGLGDTGNDLVVYGSKLYIAVTGEDNVEVTDLSAKSVKQIKAEGQPRYLAAANGKVYVSFIDGKVAQIDTASLNIEKTVAVGRNPEQMAVVGNKLYVANSGGQDYPANYDNTVSVINLSTFTEEKKITVNMNPCNMLTDSNGSIYLISNGDYGLNPGKVQKIDTSNGDAVTNLEVGGTEAALLGSTLFLLHSVYDENWNPTMSYNAYNIETNSVISTNFVGSAQFAADPYKIFSDSVSEELYITTSDYVNNGDVYIFDKSGGVLKTRFEAGLNPVKVIKVYGL